MSASGYNQTSAFDDDDIEGTNDSRHSLDQEYGNELGENAKLGNQRLTNEVYPDPIADRLVAIYQGMNLHKNDTLRFGLLASPLLAIVLFYMLVSQSTSAMISFSAFTFSIVFIGIAMWILCEILIKDVGPKGMQEIAEVILQGSEGFFVTQYGTIFFYAGCTSVGLFAMYAMRDIPAQSKLNTYFSPLSMAFITSISFLLGAVCSAIAGYAGIWVSVRANLRVAAASKKCYNDAIVICFRGGAFAAIVNVALAIFGVSSLFMCFEFYFFMVGATNPPIEEIPALLVGFGFGASFVAMFAQLGGGIYTKAADVGADLIGKVEVGIPEDDPRNPAVVADLVGDNVGDCAGQCADLFESISAEIISAMILGGVLAEKAGMDFETKSGFILFPLLVHTLDLLVSTIGVFFVSTKPGLPSLKKDYGELEDPLDILKRGYYVSLGLAIIGLFYICKTFLYVAAYP